MIRELINSNFENIEVLDIISFEEKKDNEGKSKYTVLAKVKWFDNEPVVEKRQYFYKKDGVFSCGKCMGLKAQDLENIIANFESLIGIN